MRSPPVCVGRRETGFPASRKGAKEHKGPDAGGSRTPGLSAPSLGPAPQPRPGGLQAARMAPPLSQGLAALRVLLASSLLTTATLKTGLALRLKVPKESNPTQRPAFQNIP